MVAIETWISPEDCGILLREADALQTFPDDCAFRGTHSSIARQICTAGSVKLTKALGQQSISLVRN